jgi:hypothetical protein
MVILCVAIARRMEKCNNQDVIGQWPELALMGITPDAAMRNPPTASTSRARVPLRSQRFIDTPY